MRTSRRLAPRSGSTSSWIIELNCFPRRVLRRNRPSGMSRSGSDTTVKRARPSGVAKTPPSQRREPPYWKVSPFTRRSWIPSYVGTARVGRVDHSDRGHAMRCRRAESPYSLEAGRVLVVHRKPESEVLRVRAHLGTSLDAAMPSDRHETAFGPSDDPACEAEVHDRLHVVHAEPMVGDAHAPHEDGRSRPAVHLGEVEHGLPPEA